MIKVNGINRDVDKNNKKPVKNNLTQVKKRGVWFFNIFHKINTFHVNKPTFFYLENKGFFEKENRGGNEK